MKIRGEILLLTGLLALMLAGCQKDLRPRGTVGTEDALRTTEDAKMWSRGLLSMFRYRHGGLYYLVGAEIQGDMLIPKAEYGNRNGYMYKQTFTPSDEITSECYFGYYNLIKNANFVLDNIDGVVVENPKDTTTIPTLRGQAYFVRAFCYEKLMSRYTRPEDPTTPGVALLLHYDMSKDKANRASQQDVFNQIYSDLDAAAKFLKKAGIKGKINSAEITPDGVIALRARTALTQLNWDKALKNAEELIQGGIYALESDPQKLKNMWHNDSESPEIIMQSYAKRGDESPNANSSFLSFNTNLRVYDQDWYPTQEALDLFDAKDARKDIYFFKGTTLLLRNRVPINMICKYPGASDLRTYRNVANGSNRPKTFRTAEQYLIAAEAAFKLGDETKAKKYLNALRTARGLQDVTSSGDDLWKEIKNERTRELAYEGFRISDLRRWGDPLKKQSPQTGFENMMLPLHESFSLPAGDNRFVWPIPTADVQLGNLQQNPGY